jgi:hypothetical protein
MIDEGFQILFCGGFRCASNFKAVPISDFILDVLLSATQYKDFYIIDLGQGLK